MGVTSFSHADALRFVNMLPKQAQRLIRPMEVESVCKAALDLKDQYGILEAIPKVLEHTGITRRSKKEQAAYRRLLLLLLVGWRKPKRQPAKASPQPPEGPLLAIMRTPVPEKPEKVFAQKRDLFD